MLDTKVYVRTDPAVCYHRRLTRDVAERGRTPESVREQYERCVRPSAEWFVYPTEKYANLDTGSPTTARLPRPGASPSLAGSIYCLRPAPHSALL
jgi:uridine kinase